MMCATEEYIISHIRLFLLFPFTQQLNNPANCSFRSQRYSRHPIWYNHFLSDWEGETTSLTMAVNVVERVRR
jgi:hypothetical protein